jgi:hypothetical protein
MQHLDRDDGTLLSIERLPHEREPAPTDLLQQQISLAAQRVPGAELAALTKPAPQLEDLLIDLLRRGTGALQLFLPRDRALHLFAERTSCCIGIFRRRTLDLVDQGA